MTLFFIIVLISGLTSCTYFLYPPTIETRTEIQFSKYWDKNLKIRKLNIFGQKASYERYNSMGNIIEAGQYGEEKFIYEEIKSADSSSFKINNNGYNYKNLRTVQYFVYDLKGLKLYDELWQFKNNKKDFLVSKTKFDYDTTNALIKETRHDNNNRITSLKYYSKVNSNTIVSKDSIFNFSPEGIKKVEGILIDTIISDTRSRPIYKIQYYNNKFQHRQEFRYQNWGSNIVTELNYYFKPDSLWSIKEWQYSNLTNLPIREFRKTIGRGLESKAIYVYNRKQLLVKVLWYSGDELDGYHHYNKYKYKFFK